MNLKLIWKNSFTNGAMLSVIVLFALLLGIAQTATAQEIAVVQKSFDTSLWQLSGDAGWEPGVIRLTNSVNDVFGAAYYKRRIFLANGNSFSAFFTFTLTEHFDYNDAAGNSEAGADGVCFVLQGLSNTAGTTGEGIGYAGVSPSIAVEFDTYQNGGSKEPGGVSGENHVAILEDGNNGTTGAHLAWQNVPGTNALQDGTWSVWVDYNGATNVMEVRYVKNSMSRPASANIWYAIDIASKFPNGVFMGFSSATGGCRSKHVVDNVLFCNNYVSGGLDPNGAYTPSTPPPAPDPHLDTVLRGTSATLTGTCTADPTVSNYTWFNSPTGENPVGTGTTYTTGNLNNEINYFYYSAINAAGLQSLTRATYTVNTFTIGPATNPNPADGAVEVMPTDAIRWDPPTQGVATGYEVYLGTVSPPQNMAANVDVGLTREYPATFHAGTTYYWMIVPREVHGYRCTTTAIWSFTRAFIQPATPRWPADGELEVVPVDSLRWTPPATGEPVTGYRLYLGTDPQATNVINGEDVGDVVSYFMNWSLEPKTQYFWRVVPYNALGDVCLTPPTWTFTRNSFRRGFARYLAAPLAALPNTEVQFTNACGGAQNSFLWNFGDGELAGFKHEVTDPEKIHPSHLYPEAGLYTVSLKSWGCWLNSPDDELIINDLICIDGNYAALSIVDGSETNEGYGWDKVIDHDIFTTNCKVVTSLPDAACTFMFADSSVRNVERVRVFTDDIYKTNYAGHLVQEFEVWCSLDQVTWTKALDGVIPWENRGTFTDFTFPAITARYVKLNLTVPHNPDAKTIQLTEFQVFGPKNEDMTLDKNIVMDNAPVTEFKLEQNYPNPFNPTTTINFAVPEAGHVSLQVYNVTGQLITELVNGKMESGRHQVVFDAAHLPTGIYFCKMKTASYSNVTRMILMK